MTATTNANLYTLISRSVEAAPDRVAITHEAGELSYATLAALTAKVAGLLAAHGVRPGDRVGVMMPNHPAFALAYFGAIRAGAVVVPMNTLLKEREVNFYLSDSEAKVVFAWHECRAEVESAIADLDTVAVFVAPGEFDAMLGAQPALDEITERAASDTAVVLYTSGTTGRPKGAELTHGNLSRNAEIARGLFSLTPDDVVIGALPLFHSFGQTCSLNAVLATGAQLVMVQRFHPEAVLRAIQDHKATLLMGVPTMYSALLHQPGRESFDVSSLRMCASGGAALPLDVLNAFEAGFGCALLEGYGLSETSPIASFNMADNRKPGTIGLPIEGVEMRVVDTDGAEVPVGEIGEIAIRGHNVMKGYWRRPEETAAVLDADGWFRTGDLGQMDEDGFFSIVDRKKDMIIRGGYNVYPREIEEVLYEHPAVRECAVIGIAHDSLGEEVGAAVVLTEPDAISAADLREWVRGQVAAYKYPRHLWFVDALPKGATNKILKREIAIPAEVSR
jgi:long-chain acyl-CoA synthetase